MKMNQKEKEAYLQKLEDEFLLGGATLSEWSIFWIHDADAAFCAGANLAAILSAQAAMESNLRYEYFANSKQKLGFFDLIEQSPVPSDLKKDLHKIRKFRNKWVHIKDPADDEELLQRPGEHECELEEMAAFAIRTMMRVVFLEQWV